MHKLAIAFLGFFLLLSAPVCSAQNRSVEQQATAFIKTMYNQKQFEDYSFLRSHCTKKLLKKLADNFGYECDGTCYATWLFRSGAQDEKYGPYSYYGNGVNATKVLSVVAKDDHWYAYTALDMGWKFTNWVYLIKSGNTFLIDDVITVSNEMEEE